MNLIEKYNEHNLSLKFKGRKWAGTFKESIKKLIQQIRPWLKVNIDLEQQLQPNGFDITLRDVADLQNMGQIGKDNAQRSYRI